MKITFVNLKREMHSNHPVHLYAPLDLGYCISLAEREGHEVFFIDANVKCYDKNKVISLIKESKCQAVVIKPEINTESLALDITSKISNDVIYKIIIGPVATMQYKDFIFKGSPINFLILEEPEMTFLELIRQLDSRKNFKKVPGLVFFNKKLVINKSKILKNLDKLPFPDHKTFLKQGYTFCYPVNTRKKINISYMLASRGCPNECIFCSPIERVSYSHVYRTRSGKNITAEMAYLEKKGSNTVYFRDDNFTASKECVKNICDEIIKNKIAIKWVAQCRVGSLDSELLMKMRHAGCSTLCLGVESGTDRVLKVLKKGISTKDVIDTSKMIRKSGIWQVFFLIIGNPTETYKEMKQTLSLAKHLNPEMVQVHLFTIYPGSLAFDKSKHKCPGSSKFSTTTNLEAVQKSFYLRYYFNPRYIKLYFTKQMPNLMTNWKVQKELISKTMMFLLKPK